MHILIFRQTYYYITGFALILLIGSVSYADESKIQDPYEHTLNIQEKNCCGEICKDKSMDRALVDINDDRESDLILFPETCRGMGGGPVHVYVKIDKGYRFVGILGSQPHCLKVLDSKHLGLRDMRSYFRHEGVSHWKFDGSSYIQTVIDDSGAVCGTNFKIEHSDDLKNWTSNTFFASFYNIPKSD